MKIDSYEIGMESARTYSRVRSEGLSTNLGFTLNTGEGENSDVEGSESLSTSFKSNMKDAMEELNSKIKARSITSDETAKDEFEKLHYLMVKNILKLLMGEGTLSDYEGDDYYMEATEFSGHGSYEKVTETAYYQYSYEESEYTSFSAQGLVKTSDGREISLNLDIEMSRSFSETYTEGYEITSYRLVDPIVINYDTDAASLSDLTIRFDLDGDGEKEEIKNLSKGSGFLAFDKNENGIIDDGSELFGPRSGNGFFDLSLLDEDENGWLDDNDSSFRALKILTFDEGGNSHTYSLSAKDIGAIYLGSEGTEYSLTDVSNQAGAYIKQTGIFLYETGLAGTLQHVDYLTQA